MSLAFLARARESIVSLVAPNAFLAEGRTGRTGWVRPLGTFLLGQLFAAVPAVALFAMHRPSLLLAASAAAHPGAAFAELLFDFGLLLVGLLVGVRFLQRRPASSVFHVTGRAFRWRRWAQGFGLTAGIAALAAVVQHVVFPGSLVWAFVPGVYWSTLPWAVVSLAVQTLAEEVIFRAWLPQTLAGKRQRVTFAVIGSGLLFLLGHLANPEMAIGGAFLPAFVECLVITVTLAVVAVREEGIELSWGVHFANNLCFVLLSGVAGGVVPTVALFQAGTRLPWFNTGGALLLALVVLAALRLPKSARQNDAGFALQSMR